MPPYTPQAVANYFLDRADQDDVVMDPMKLIKLVYISYGWVLALTGQRLFLEEIQAWRHGPVIRSVYDEFKRFGARDITVRAREYDLDEGTICEPTIDDGDERTLGILNRVWAAYSQFSGWTLRKKTHEPGTPWHDAFHGKGMNSPIPDRSIATHFQEIISDILVAAKRYA